MKIVKVEIADRGDSRTFTYYNIYVDNDGVTFTANSVQRAMVTSFLRKLADESNDVFVMSVPDELFNFCVNQFGYERVNQKHPAISFYFDTLKEENGPNGLAIFKVEHNYGFSVSRAYTEFNRKNAWLIIAQIEAILGHTRFGSTKEFFVEGEAVDLDTFVKAIRLFVKGE